MGHRQNDLKCDVYLSVKVVLIYVNSEVTDKMLHFIWVFTVCQSTLLGVSSIQRVKDVSIMILLNVRAGFDTLVMYLKLLTKRLKLKQVRI